jgi:hypothetical protein
VSFWKTPCILLDAIWELCGRKCLGLADSISYHPQLAVGSWWVVVISNGSALNRAPVEVPIGLTRHTTGMACWGAAPTDHSTVHWNAATELGRASRASRHSTYEPDCSEFRCWTDLSGHTDFLCRFVAEVEELRAAWAVLFVIKGGVDWPRYRIGQFPPHHQHEHQALLCLVLLVLQEGDSGGWHLVYGGIISDHLDARSHALSSRGPPNRVRSRIPGPASAVWDPLLRGGADFPYPCFRAPPQNLVGPGPDANMQLDERRSRRED